MSEKVGPISYLAPQDDGLPPAFQRQPYSEATSELIDAEIRRIVDESHREADRLLDVHRAQLDALAHALLKAESLNEQEIREAIGLPQTREPSRATTEDDMPSEPAISIDQLTLPKLLEAYTDARLAKRDDEMKRIEDEISRRRTAPGAEAEPSQDKPGQP